MTPERTLEQRRDALEISLHVRTRNAALKRHLATLPRGEAAMEAAQIIRQPVLEQDALRLNQLLQSVTSVGEYRVIRFLHRSVVKPHQKLRSISATQRAMVAARVEEQACVWLAEEV